MYVICFSSYDFILCAMILLPKFKINLWKSRTFVNVVSRMQFEFHQSDFNYEYIAYIYFPVRYAFHLNEPFFYFIFRAQPLLIFHCTACIVVIKKLTTTASRRYISRSAYECVMYARRICQLQYCGVILDCDSTFSFSFFFFFVILQLLVYTVNFMRLVNEYVGIKYN